MAITMTKLSGPIKQSGKGVEYTFSIALDTVFPTGGEILDLTDYLSYMTGGYAAGADAIADVTRTFDVVGPGKDVAVSATNVVLTAHHGSGSDAVNNPSDAEDLAAIGALIVTVWGKDAIVSSWA